jgi:hypothetical protein
MLKKQQYCLWLIGWSQSNALNWTKSICFIHVRKFKHGNNCKNIIPKEIDSNLNSGITCYYWMQNLFYLYAIKKWKVDIYRTVILHVILYGGEAWTLTLRECHRLKVQENRVLRRIFGLKMDEMIESWRHLFNEELHNLCPSPDVIGMIKSRRMRCKHMGRRGMHVGFWWENHKGRPLWRASRRWEDNIEMHHIQVGWGGAD